MKPNVVSHVCIPALRRLRREDCKFKASQIYHTTNNNRCHLTCTKHFLNPQRCSQYLLGSNHLLDNLRKESIVYTFQVVKLRPRRSGLE